MADEILHNSDDLAPQTLRGIELAFSPAPVPIGNGLGICGGWHRHCLDAVADLACRVVGVLGRSIERGLNRLGSIGAREVVAVQASSMSARCSGVTRATEIPSRARSSWFNDSRRLMPLRWREPRGARMQLHALMRC